LSFTDMTPQTITVRAVNDQSIEGLHSGMISHAITGAVVDPNYPDVTPDDLYTVNGTDRTFQQLLDDGALRPGQNWAGGVQGSEVDVNNAILEQGIPSNLSIPQNINAHTLNASVIGRQNFDNITRWYQEDGKTQVFRLFEGEENVRNDREYAARIETFANAGTAVWNDFSVRFTVLKAESVSLIQNKQNSDASWGLHVGMTPEGDIHYTHRRNHDGGSTRFTLAEDMIGKSFEILVRDNGHDFELYFNGELKAKSYWERPGRDFTWRWGPYRGARPMEHDVLVFANNVQLLENTSAPVGLVPYRLPTTSLSIDAAIAQITDSDPVNPEITSVVLVDADADVDISELTDGMVLNLTTLPTRNLNIRATGNPDTESVQFELTGPSPRTQTESTEPFALFGDSNGDFHSEPLSVGQYTLVVTPYTENGLGGSAGNPVTINFEIIEPVQEQFAPLTESSIVQDGTVIRAEEFDTGGQDVAYFDTTAGNQGGSARADEDVDLYAGSIVLSNIADGEWVEFTRDVVPGVYDVDVRAWSTNSNAKGVRLFIAEDASSSSFTELGYVSVPDTNNDRVSHTIENVDLTNWGGEDRVIRVAFEGSNFSYDWIEFRSEMDFGDAPESYGTLTADDGARHAATGPQLGATRDSESDGSPSPGADGDGTDEDGVLFGAIGAGSPGAAVNIELANLAQGESAKVDAWIDFDRNGTFDVDEKILDDITVNQAMQTINYDVPAGITVGDAYARVRISTAGGLGPTGFAADGEVEDYVVSIIEPPTVESIQVNSNDSQRSSVDSVRVTFDRVVDIDTAGGNPFQLIHSGIGQSVTIQAPLQIDHSTGKTIVDLAFDPAGPHVTSFGSLQDGDYQLTINAALVTDRGVQLDGNGNGSAGGNHVMSAVDGLFRKYGDADGNGSVGLADFAAFRSTFGKSVGEAGYFSGLDSNGDGEIGLSDFAAFRAKFGT
jgi:hypothetical protein